MFAFLYLAFAAAAVVFGYRKGHWYGKVGLNYVGRIEAVMAAALFCAAIVLNITVGPSPAIAVFTVIAAYFWSGMIARINLWCEENAPFPLYKDNHDNATFLGRVKHHGELLDLYIVQPRSGESIPTTLLARTSSNENDFISSSGQFGEYHPAIEEAYFRAVERGIALDETAFWPEAVAV